MTQEQNYTNHKKAPFEGALDNPHSRVDPCFMTGKGCVYTEVIDRSLAERRESETYRGFSVMPFRPNCNVFFKNCLSLFFTSNYQNAVTLERADEIRRPGIIICEGICKRIQEADFVTVDVSLPNPNVFYELGLAFGIGHKILVICHHNSEFGGKTAAGLRELGCPTYSYHDLDPIKKEDIDTRRMIWYRPSEVPTPSLDKPRILLYEQILDGLGPQNNQAGGHTIPVRLDDQGLTVEEFVDDIELAFGTHVRSAVGLAINRICAEVMTEGSIVAGYRETIQGFGNAEVVKTDASLREIQSQVDSSYCMIMRTGFKSCHPMTYFWLGYGHAKGKNVIPVTLIKERDERVEDFAFDIRAQRHMFFIKRAPERFEIELTSSLTDMIEADFSEWSRKHFWDQVIGRRGEVSIFTGALHNETFGREMIGDWDLRTASELTSYLASRQYRAKIENPVYTPEYPKLDRGGRIEDYEDYIKQLRNMLYNKNCILIASPDVNPLTEIVLGSIYGIEDKGLFKTLDNPHKHPDVIMVVKERELSEGTEGGTGARRCFYKEVPPKGGEPKRGFESPQFVSGTVMESFLQQVDDARNEFLVHGHLVIMRNPWWSGTGNRPYIVILNGVSGPATFALTHVLTGGMTKDFVAYSESFDPSAKSEQILRTLMDDLAHRKSEVIDCIITVRVGPSGPDPVYTSDWRRILSWELNETVRRKAINAFEIP